MGKIHLTGTAQRVYCRAFQTVMKGADYFLGYRMPEYTEGPGSVKKLPNLLKSKGEDNILIVTGPNIYKRGLADGMLKSLDEAGLEYTVFCDVDPNPTSDNVEAGFRVWRENGCRSLVAFGGGGPIDCAKAIAAKSVHPKKSVSDLHGIMKVHRKIPTLIAIPTTSGTGSETTVAAVIVDSKSHRKASINDPCLLPGCAILDPELTVGLPPHTTATTGLDALCHAVEAYTNKTYNTDLEDFLAKEAVRLIYENLLKAYNDGSDITARQNMQKAAFYAGRAFTRGCVGYVHAIGHTLGGLYGVPHGLAMSIILPHVMRRFGTKVYDRLADLADVCGMEGVTKSQKALKFIAWIEDIKKKTGIPAGADMIKKKDVPQIIDWAIQEANPLYPVPVVWDRADFKMLIADLVSAGRK